MNTYTSAALTRNPDFRYFWRIPMRVMTEQPRQKLHTIKKTVPAIKNKIKKTKKKKKEKEKSPTSQPIIERYITPDT